MGLRVNVFRMNAGPPSLLGTTRLQQQPLVPFAGTEIPVREGPGLGRKSRHHCQHGQLVSKKPAKGQEGLGKALRMAFAFSFQRSESSRCLDFMTEQYSGLCSMESRLQPTNSSGPGLGWSLEVPSGCHIAQREALEATS